MLKINSKAPDFITKNQADETIKLSDYKGQWVLLYFYPKDNTPGCTVEACTLRDNYNAFKKIKAVVLGVSKDTVKSHAGFTEKYALPFPLLADPAKIIIDAYQVTSRVSYLINPQGMIAKIYEKVKPAEHASEVIKDLVELSK